VIDGIEFDVDMVTTRSGDMIAFVSEQLDPAGIHSGDSVAVWPVRHRAEADIAESAAKKIASAVHAVGITNAQIIVKDKKAYVIELNARASRTATFISKAAKINLVSIAISALLNFRLDHVTVSQTECKKMPVFSKRLPVMTLGPIMTSTGERFVRSIEG
jgi:carbamoyl-phosphate synthase large subunit